MNLKNNYNYKNLNLKNSSFDEFLDFKKELKIIKSVQALYFIEQD